MKLLRLAAAFLAGVYVGTLETPWAASVVALLAALALVGTLVRSRGIRLAPALLTLALALGLLRGAVIARDVSAVADVADRPLTLVGTVSGDPALSNGWARFRVDNAQVQLDADEIQKVPGGVLVTVRPPAELAEERDPPFFRPGDLVSLQGTLEFPPVFDDFDYRDYLERQGILWVMAFPQVELTGTQQPNVLQRALSSSRASLGRSLKHALPEPHAALAQAILLGQRSDLPDDTTQAFRDSGTAHLLAISGLHVGVVLALTLGAATWALGRQRGTYLMVPLLILWGYAALSGMSPSVERAAIMGSIYLLALAVGRQTSLLPALAAAASVMVGLDPNLLENVSFQLSFTAIAGLALLAPPIQQWLERGAQRLTLQGVADSLPLKGSVTAIAVSTGAILGTLPLLTFYFHRLSLVSLPATLLSIPALPLALGLSLLTALADLVWPALGWMLGWGAWLALGYIITMARLFAAIPFAAVDLGPFSGWLVVLYYGALLGLVTRGQQLLPESGVLILRSSLRRITEQVLSPLPLRRWMLLPTALVAALVWLAALSGSDGRLHLTLLDVGAGDALLLQTPGGYQVLIDGGPGRLEAVGALGRHLPFWDRSLNAVVLTHPQSDHITGLLDVLRRYRVDLVVESGVELAYATPEYVEWRRLTEGMPRLVARQGQELRFPDGTRLQVLNPPDPPLSATAEDVNNASVTLLVSYGQVDLLLTGDIEGATEVSLVGRNLVPAVEVLKVAHHGSATSSSQAFLQAASPLLSVVSAAPGQPNPDVLARLKAFTHDQRVLVTAEHGEIEVITDGERLWVK